MNKTILTAGIVGILALGGTAFFGGDKDEISKVKFTEKYNTSVEVKAKYQIEGSALKMVAKNNPKDMVRVEIGNKDDADFTPKLKISRWDEVDFSITPRGLDTIAKKDKTLTFDKEKIKLGTPKKDYILYEMPISEANPEGAYEYEVVLKEKPDTNVVEFILETNGLDFFYQPELTQQKKDEGASQPENVIGSYAVYASEQKTNWTGGKLYRTGKIGHIYRPKIIDSAGTEVWGDLHIENGILSVTIPQDFLDTCVYPIQIK